jgi:hypothetical protein
MNISEEDLKYVMNCDRLKITDNESISFNGTLKDAYDYLKLQFINSGFSRLDIPSIDAENPKTIFSIGTYLEKLTNGFEKITGNKSIKPGINNCLLLGDNQTISSGYATKELIAVSVDATNDDILHILAHECLHAHDYKMSNNQDALSEYTEKSKNKDGLLGQWYKFFEKINKNQENINIDWDLIKEKLFSEMEGISSINNISLNFKDLYKKFIENTILPDDFRKNIEVFFDKKFNNDNKNKKTDFFDWEIIKNSVFTQKVDNIIYLFSSLNINEKDKDELAFYLKKFKKNEISFDLLKQNVINLTIKKEKKSYIDFCISNIITTCNLIKRGSQESSVWKQFMKEYYDVSKSIVNNQEDNKLNFNTLEPEYFISNSEVSARVFEAAFVFIADLKEHKDLINYMSNPTKKESEIYLNYWQEFYKSHDVVEFYKNLNIKTDLNKDEVICFGSAMVNFDKNDFSKKLLSRNTIKNNHGLESVQDEYIIGSDNYKKISSSML